MISFEIPFFLNGDKVFEDDRGTCILNGVPLRKEGNGESFLSDLTCTQGDSIKEFSYREVRFFSSVRAAFRYHSFCTTSMFLFSSPTKVRSIHLDLAGG